MRIALINQTFFPDVLATGQYLADLAVALSRRGHRVTVVTSRRSYDDPAKVFPKQEIWQGIRIVRLWNTGFGKSAKWRRAADFASFLLSCCGRLALLPRQDLVVALTSPPLVSFIGALFARLRGGRFCYWVMDLNPDEAVAAGWLVPGSLAARFLEALSRFSLRQASRIIALDRFMEERLLAKGVDARKIAVIPPWSHDSDVRFDAEGRARFRSTHGLNDKFVVMYSGNHSPCHPLDSVLEAVRNMAPNKDVVFCFIGGGSEFGRVRQFAQDHRLANVRCLPYQARTELAGSLSAADLHLVVMGNPFVGIVHPCKVYNIMRVGSPILYIGPVPSHVSEALAQGGRDLAFDLAPHGQPALIERGILQTRQEAARRTRQAPPLLERFSSETLLARMVRLLEEAAGSSPVHPQPQPFKVQGSGFDVGS